MKTTLKRWLISMVTLAALFDHALAAPVIVTNPGFEDITGESPVNEFTFGPLNGWELYDPNGVTNGGAGGTFYIGTLTPFEPDPINEPGLFANFPDGAAEGQRVGIAFNFEGSDGIGEYGFEQVLSEPLQPNTRYSLDVEIGNIDSAIAMSGQFFPLGGFPGYRVDLFTEDEFGVQTNIDSDDNTLAGIVLDGEFSTSNVTFVTGAEHPQLGENLGIRLVNLNELDPLFPDSDIEVDFDDVRLDATVLTPGDLNGDGSVNGTDFLVWQTGNPTAYGPTDLSNWTSHYGNAFAAASTVPEPNAFAQAIASVLLSLIAAKPCRRCEG